VLDVLRGVDRFVEPGQRCFREQAPELPRAAGGLQAQMLPRLLGVFVEQRVGEPAAALVHQNADEGI